MTGIPDDKLTRALVADIQQRMIAAQAQAQLGADGVAPWPPALPPWASQAPVTNSVKLEESFEIKHNDPKFHDPDYRTKKLDFATEKLVQRALDDGLIEVEQTKDNVAEVTRFTIRTEFVKRAKLQGAKLGWIVLDEASEHKPEEKPTRIPKHRVKALAAQIGGIVEKERATAEKAGTVKGYKEGMADALKMVEDLQRQILPETTGTFIANLLWFRLNDKAGG